VHGRRIVLAAVALLRVTVQIATLQLGVKGSEVGLGVVMSRTQERLSVIVVYCMGKDLNLRDDVAMPVFR
jgi:hypothetical protein